MNNHIRSDMPSLGPRVPGGNIGMNGANARGVMPDYGPGRQITAYQDQQRYMHPVASNEENIFVGNDGVDLRPNQPLAEKLAGSGTREDGYGTREDRGIPNWYLNSDAPPVPYDGPSPLKDHIVLKQQVEKAARQAASRDVANSDNPLGAGAVVYNAGDLSAEVEYTKTMRDKAELAKFDDYVSTMIDPREPGNLQWLMEVYPNFVTRRLQHAHSEYEFALKKQMIDQWGVNTFDDLHFLYMCDQGKFKNMPLLMRQNGASPGDEYAPGFLSPHNSMWKEMFKGDDKDNSHRFMGLPYSSAQHGRRPNKANAWDIDRTGRPMSEGRVDAFGGATFQEPTRPARPDRDIAFL